MRGILFALSFVMFLVGCCLAVDGAVAGTGASTAVFGWGWFAAALIALVLAPDRGISKEAQIEADFFEAAENKEVVWIDVDLSDLDSLDETLNVQLLTKQIETINGWIDELVSEINAEVAFEAALEEDTRHFNTWTVEKKVEITAILDQVEAYLWADHLINMPRNNTPWLPPSLGLKA
jgi:hypothetical protein